MSSQSAPGSKKLLKASAVMALGTLGSRLLGFVRLALLAVIWGNGTRSIELFTLSQYIPSSLYIIFAGGALNTVLVPQIVRAMVHHEDDGKAFVDRIMTIFLVALGVLTLLMTAATPLLLHLFANDAWRAPALSAHYASMTLMTYTTMPQLFFYGAFFLIGQVLNAKEEFAPMQWAPILNNVITIAVLGLYVAFWGTSGDPSAPFTTQQSLLLGIGSTVGILAQTLVLIPYLGKVGYTFKPRWDFRGTGLRRIVALSGWALGSVALTQVASIVVNNLASSATANPGGHLAAGMTVYGNAMLLWTLPHSLITVSLATAILTTLSQHASRQDLDAVTTETMRTTRLAATVQVPAMFLFFVLAAPMSALLFGHGRGSADSILIADTVIWLAIGTIPFMVTYVLYRGFYALEDNKTPFFIQLVISAVNAGAALVLVLSENEPATVAQRLGLAYSLAYLVGAVVCFVLLKRRLPGLSPRELLQKFARLSLASLPAAGVAWGIVWFAGIWDSMFITLVGFVVAGVVALGVFVLVARLLHIEEADQMTATVLRRFRRGDAESTSPDGEATEIPDTPEAAEQSAGAIDDDREVADAVASGAAATTTLPAGMVAPLVVSGTVDPADLYPAAEVTAGAMLGRYRVDEHLDTRAGLQAWRGYDTALSRSVMIQILGEGDPRQAEFLLLSRQAAVATDSRFLRVLDVEAGGGPGIGAYAVHEYATAQTLSTLLAQGELTGREAAWITRELADGLWPMHHQNLFHRELNPDTVVITATGDVKILSFLVEGGLHPTPGPEYGRLRDVQALGRLLYATLVARWPGGDLYGLRAAPTDAYGRLLTPSQVKAGVPRPLDDICDRILSDTPRGRVTKLTSAHEIVAALNGVLGGISAAPDLQRRLRSAAAGASTAPLAPLPPVATSTAGAAPLSQATVRPASAAAPSSPPSPASGVSNTRAADSETESLPFTPVPPPARRTTTSDVPLLGGDTRPDGPRFGARWLLIGFVALLVLGIGTAVANQLGGKGPSAAPSGSAASTAGVALAISGIRDFDPKGDGGSGNENAKLAPLAIDKEVDTAWTTERYKGKPNLGGLKPGVGLVVDLGSVQDVSSVVVNFVGAGTNAEVRVPTQLAADAPPMTSVKDWSGVASVNAAPDGNNTFTFASLKARFILVYLTSLPAENATFIGGVREITVRR